MLYIVTVRQRTSFANIFVVKVETEILNQSALKPLIWKRYLLYMYWDLLQNELLNKNDALQSTRNLIGCMIFLKSEKYRMTNHKPQTKVFTSDKNRIGFPAFHWRRHLAKGKPWRVLRAIQGL